MRSARLDPKNYPPGANPGSSYLDPSRRIANWDDIHDAINYLVKVLRDNHYLPEKIVGISRGGAIPAVMLAHKLGIVDVDYLRISSYPTDSEPSKAGRLRIHLPFDVESMKELNLNPMTVLGHHAKLLDKPTTLIVDELCGSGQTMQWIKDGYPQAKLATLYWVGNKEDHYPKVPIHFPGIKLTKQVKDPSKLDIDNPSMVDVWYNMPWETLPKDWVL